MASYPIPNHPWLTVVEAPLYRQTFPRSVTDAQLAAMLAEVERITMAMRSPYGWIADLSNLMEATAKQRSMYAESDRRLSEIDRQFCAGCAVYCVGSVGRGILTAVHWLTPPAYPFKVFGDLAVAEQWARAQLIARGVTFKSASNERPAPRLSDKPAARSSAPPPRNRR